MLYIKSFDDYKVFALQNPFRIVMDIKGSGKTPEDYNIAKNEPKYETPLPQDKVSSLSQALGLKIRTVVIDAGHGGHDPGAIGPSGLKEKDVNPQDREGPQGEARQGRQQIRHHERLSY